MQAIKSIAEPYEISARFCRAMQVKVLTLEVDALRDELVAATIENPEQLRRQRLLVQTQRDEAGRLRQLLDATSIRASRTSVRG